MSVLRELDIPGPLLSRGVTTFGEVAFWGVPCVLAAGDARTLRCDCGDERANEPSGSSEYIDGIMNEGSTGVSRDGVCFRAERLGFEGEFTAEARCDDGVAPPVLGVFPSSEIGCRGEEL